MAIADYVEQRLELDQPINIHVTGCSHSCAQHYIGDIGLLGANVEVGDDVVEGYQVFVGGGYGERQQIGRELFPPTPSDDLPPLVARMLEVYLERRRRRTRASPRSQIAMRSTSCARCFPKLPYSPMLDLRNVP